jgi:hypothetical protein
MKPKETKEEDLQWIDLDVYIFKSPASDYTPDSQIGIECVSIDDNYTRIDFTYISPKDYPDGGWVQMYGSAFIRPSGSDKKYYLIKAINIPIAPNKHIFKKSGQLLQFTLFFPALPKTVTEIDIIEKLAPGTYFNFFRVGLTKNQPLLISINHNLN